MSSTIKESLEYISKNLECGYKILSNTKGCVNFNV